MALDVRFRIVHDLSMGPVRLDGLEVIWRSAGGLGLSGCCVEGFMRDELELLVGK